TAVADSGKVISESAEGNNSRKILVRALPDVALTGTPYLPAVTAGELNYSGVNNVHVQATVRNLGQAELRQIPVRLLWALDDGPFQDAGSVVIPALAADDWITLDFIADGLAGHN